MPCPMFFENYTRGKTQSIWAETQDCWDDVHPSWKAVGESPRRMLRSEIAAMEFIPKSIQTLCNIVNKEKIYYNVVFPSGRKGIGMYHTHICEGEYVIIEADRGEDCACVGSVSPQAHENFKVEVKSIIRLASKLDIEILGMRRKHEQRALLKCVEMVQEYGFPMEITRCEFQWDMKKITFYFVSSKRIDFRSLVKELFKYFKIRIWMSMENRV
ncbi:hypothetical protein ENBRE01_2076 [Enteropsectra breve]|nr:hypothetical protein ENBRE01_2076 [Enteropsectra breve]